jgi:2-polyprenyl-3-methyl-5-hydroxy-6-metoxy-1,4-benzoquinol methylase
VPTSNEAILTDYYQKKYRSGFTTEIPDDETLTTYLNKGFTGTPKDFSRCISILQALGVQKGGRLLDLGCSWGYGVWQFREAGYDAFGLEVGKERAAFARKRLGVSAVSSLDEVDGTFDVVFSSHVLEHIANLQTTLAFAKERLRPNGLFVAITPNGSAEFRARSPAQWNRLWGFKHPLFLDNVFWQTALEGRPYILTSDFEDMDAMSRWSAVPVATVGPLSGWELLVVFKK